MPTLGFRRLKIKVTLLHCPLRNFCTLSSPVSSTLNKVRMQRGPSLVPVSISHVYREDGLGGEVGSAVQALVAIGATEGMRGHMTLQVAVLKET